MAKKKANIKKKASDRKKASTKKSYEELMIVNDEFGVETRVAIMEQGCLEEFYTERVKGATGVGNIYKGRITNVESAIQAVFIDYGGEQRGFLHITDVHPRYFPGSNKSERVGKKIAKHKRPPIQECFKRGDEVLVQVLKEGIGTKGPTLTSYLSIPGSLAVMMPFMDRVGVSRKIEDEDKRKEMRKILDSINLPEGFGFILRTAGVGRGKSEINRDIAYLLRLWNLIEKRIKTLGAPCALYNESDLLIRTVRDILRPSIGAIIVDSDSAYERISNFLKIASPRSKIELVRYRDKAPIFHSFEIEQQIAELHSREVALPSGGRLVIDQTEALVAIDVNSGKSRDAKNSETNAFNTNLEAADEICRQLRLRDLGGIVINDLIDMGAASNRRKIQDRFKQNLRRDRAKSTVLPISRFGILQMTRQRIRPSIIDSHYCMCSACDGRGHLKLHDVVAADIIRHAGWLLSHADVKKVELACSALVGTSLLSSQRREIDKYETIFGKRISVRISDDLVLDRVAFYAYDAQGSDLNLDALKFGPPPSIDQLIISANEFDAGSTQSVKGKPKRSRRRGRKRPPLANAELIAGEDSFSEELALLKKPQKNSSNSPAADAMRVYQFAKQVGKSSKEIIELCKTCEIDVRNHMSTLSSDVVTEISGFIESKNKPKDSTIQKKKRRKKKAQSRSVSKKRPPRNKNVKKDSEKEIKLESSEKKDKDNSKGKKQAGRRTLYGGRRRSLTADELQANRDDRQ